MRCLDLEAASGHPFPSAVWQPCSGGPLGALPEGHGLQLGPATPLVGTAVEMGLCWFHLRAGAANASEGLVECK